MDDPTPHPDDVQQEAVVTGYYFAPIPEALLYSEVSDKAVRVYATLMRHGMDPDNCYPSHRRIAELIGAAPRSIARPIRELEDAGWIQRKVRFNPATGERTSDGWYVRTSSAPTTQENGVGPRDSARTHPAQTRGKRKQENQSQRTIGGGGDSQRCALCDGMYVVEQDDGTFVDCSCKLRRSA